MRARVEARPPRRRVALAAALVALLAIGAGQAYAARGTSTLKKTIRQGDEFTEPKDPDQPRFYELEEGPGEPFMVRDELADPQSGRAKRRKSLVYFAQLTDFQLADEESPARVEFADHGAASAWRPQEAFHAFAIDESMRVINSLSRSPVEEGDGDHAKLKLGVLTGDQADNQEYNETVWVRQLVEPGSKLNPNSGVDDFSSCDPVTRQELKEKDYKPEPNYIGVQDYDEFAHNQDYYDPNSPEGEWANWPKYPGLMNRAQLPFKTTGLKVPSYVVDGNHDGLVQGNEDANQAEESVATGCRKVGANEPIPTDPLGYLGNDEGPNGALITAVNEPAVPVPPDPKRRFVSKGEVRNIFSDGSQSDDHGFKFVDQDQDADDATRGTAWYYAWDPKPGLRFIVIDTISEGGNVQDSSEGNIDDPQFKWLEDELQKATDDGKLIVVFGHHPIRSLTADTPDENAPLCGGGYNNDDREYDGPDRDPQKGHNHAVNPGCDEDVRDSEPLHHGRTENGTEGLKELLERYPHAIAYVPGHTHENKILPCGDNDNGCDTDHGFWELNTSAVADWPQQSRLIDVMDNDDGTLSIFSFVTNHASKVGIPDPGKANSFSISDLGALGRTFSFNDPQSNRHQNSDGEKKDRNVELLIDDPRQSDTLSAQQRRERRHDKQRKHHHEDQDQTGEPEPPGPSP